jgi:hypothetical protein
MLSFPRDILVLMKNNFGHLHNEKIAEELSNKLKKIVLPTFHGFDGKDGAEKGKVLSCSSPFTFQRSLGL